MSPSKKELMNVSLPDVKTPSTDDRSQGAVGFMQRVWRSIFRHTFQDTQRNRSLAVFMNFFLHFHPVKVRRRAIAFRRTFFLGGLTAASASIAPAVVSFFQNNANISGGKVALAATAKAVAARIVMFSS